LLWDQVRQRRNRLNRLRSQIIQKNKKAQTKRKVRVLNSSSRPQTKKTLSDRANNLTYISHLL
jgi:hypothetical protein